MNKKGMIAIEKLVQYLLVALVVIVVIFIIIKYNPIEKLNIFPSFRDDGKIEPITTACEDQAGEVARYGGENFLKYCTADDCSSSEWTQIYVRKKSLLINGKDNGKEIGSLSPRGRIGINEELFSGELISDKIFLDMPYYSVLYTLNGAYIVNQKICRLEPAVIPDIKMQDLTWNNAIVVSKAGREYRYKYSSYTNQWVVSERNLNGVFGSGWGDYEIVKADIAGYSSQVNLIGKNEQQGLDILDELAIDRANIYSVEPDPQTLLIGNRGLQIAKIEFAPFDDLENYYDSSGQKISDLDGRRTLLIIGNYPDYPDIKSMVFLIGNKNFIYYLKDRDRGKAFAVGSINSNGVISGLAKEANPQLGISQDEWNQIYLLLIDAVKIGGAVYKS